jgi:Fur family transcriptional regulator, ferric uptake regulator
MADDDVLAQLAGQGFRRTRARQAIVRVLLEANGCLTPADLAERARGYAPAIGLVTVYRTVELLSQLGFIRRVHAEDGCHCYAMIGRGHRHLLTCSGCGRVVEFEGCDLSELYHRLGEETGFSISEHMLELTGTCPDCQRAGRGILSAG